MNQSRLTFIDTILLLCLGTACIAHGNEAIGALLILTLSSYALLNMLTWLGVPNISLRKLSSLKPMLVIILGLGLGDLLVGLELIEDKDAHFPFAVVQAAFCLPLLFYLLKSQSPDNAVRRCCLGKASTSNFHLLLPLLHRSLPRGQ